MVSIEPFRDCLEKNAKTSQRDTTKLELELWQATQANRHLKDLMFPAVILSMNAEQISLGLPSKFITKIRCNYSIHLALDESVRHVVGHGLTVIFKAADRECRERREAIASQELKEKKEAQIQADINRQKAEGRCNLIPFPQSDEGDPFRSALVVERHALFATNTFKGDCRIYEHTFFDAKSKTQIELYIKIGEKNGFTRTVLTQKHQEVFYKLLKLWSDLGYPIISHKGFTLGVITESAYKLVNFLKGNNSSERYQTIKKYLHEMSGIPIQIKKTVKTNCHKEIVKEEFTLLKVEWKTRQKDNMQTSAKVQICFSSAITDRFLRKEVKTLSLAQYSKLSNKRKGAKNTIAELLYPKLDYQLSTKKEYCKKLNPLLKEIEASIYKYKSQQKHKFQPTIEALSGALICSGQFRLAVGLSESANGKELIFWAKRKPIN